MERDSDYTYKLLSCAYAVHSALGPGLLESVYEKALTYELKEQGLIAKNGRINPNGLSNQDIENRVNEILNSGIDLTKYGWVNKVSKLTGLNRTTINKLVLSHPKLKEKVYYRK